MSQPLVKRLRSRARWLRLRFVMRVQSRQARSSLLELPQAPEESFYTLERARRQLAGGDPDRAEALVRASLELDLGNADAHLLLGELLLGRDASQAVNAFDQAVRFARDRRPVLHRAAALLLRRREHQRAARYVEMLLTLDARHAGGLKLKRSLEEQ